MSVALVCTWRPRGELVWLQRLRPHLERVYDHIVIVTPPEVDPTAVLPLRAHPRILLVSSPQPGWGRYLALQHGLATGTPHLHYADMDRLLHWLETKPAEWQPTIAVLQNTDCLILGRTEHAFGTHPHALQQTERIINAVASHLLGQVVDLGGGMRGLSRAAAELVVTYSAPGRWGDAEWPILVQRAGLGVTYRALDGLSWEGADHERGDVVDAATRRAAAEAYDQQARSWAKRVDTARAIVHEGLAAAQQSLMK